MPFICPDWPAPPHIHAYTTTRQGGISAPPYDSFNLGSQTGDRPKAVEQNRILLQNHLGLPSEPCWLYQTHETTLIDAGKMHPPYPNADGAYSQTPSTVCAVLTADCLPILVCNQAGTFIAAIHAGWRGLVRGIIERSLQTFGLAPQDVLVWLGPAIGPSAFEVGQDVYDAFSHQDNEAKAAFTPITDTQWLVDIYYLARLRFYQHNITAIYGGQHCTFSQSDRFYSYRRDGQQTGRMATLIWFS